MEYYSALKTKPSTRKIPPKQDTPSYATTWMKPENIMLNKISLSQKDNYCMIPLV